ncbi:MAG TPA: DUF2807 domain-containing protein [Leeuwenhoekiella sp.]|nr:DUF2807 domain-containing protein [Leeuwenhoekiella sp.]
MKNLILTQNLLIALLISIFNLGISNAQSETISISQFQEVIISPFIEVVFKQADQESVVIDRSKVDREKINVEVNHKKLHIYLDDAKVVDKEEEVRINGKKRRQDIYNGTQVSITINYKELEDVEIRGEERIDFEDPIQIDDFDLDLYGSPKVNMERITSENFKVALYGESYLEIKSGKVAFQRYRIYGSSEVNAVALESSETKIAAYGDNHIAVNVSERLKVSAFGDARIQYKGNPKIANGLKIGDTTLQKID